MNINVTIATPTDQMWGSSDPDSENINVTASYDRYCELVADELREMWPDAEIVVNWDDDDQDDSIDIEGEDYTGEFAADADGIEYVIQTVHGRFRVRRIR